MALLQGTGGTTGRRSRVDRLSAPEAEPGPVRSLLPGPEEADLRDAADPGQPVPRPGQADLRDGSGPGQPFPGTTETGARDGAGRGRPADLRVDRGLSISQDDADGQGGAALEAALLRLAAAGPTRADVLDVLVHEAAVLLQASARIAVAVEDRLIWTTSSGDGDPPIGAEVAPERTACGEAWRTGLIQNVTRPASETVISLDEPLSVAGGGAGPLTTDCCGSPPVLLAVPLLREGPPVPGRHAGFTREVFAVLALIGERANWFDDDDIEASADLAEVAGERIAALALLSDPLTKPAAAEPDGQARADLAALEQAGRPERVGPDQAGAPASGPVLGEGPVWGEDSGPAGSRELAGSSVPGGSPEPGGSSVPDGSSVTEANPVPAGSSAPDGGGASLAAPGFAPVPAAASDLEPLPESDETEQVRARTARFEWPPFLTPSPGAIPPATTSITVVPATRPGRGGFGGWFTRTPKSPPPIPGPRSGSGSVGAGPIGPGPRAGSSRRRVAGNPESFDRESGSSEAVLRDPVRAEAAQAEVVLREGASEVVLRDPVRVEATRAEVAGNDPVPGEPGNEPARGELVRSGPMPADVVESASLPADPLGPSEPIRSGPAWREQPCVTPVPSTSVPNPPASVTPAAATPAAATPAAATPVLRSPVLRSLAAPTPVVRRPVPDAPANGFGPTSRLPRARGRTTAGSAMPPAMPAADSMGLWQWDAISGECTWSSPVARLLGLAPDAELTLDLVREAVAPADRGRFDVAVRAIGTGRGVAGALRLKTADGRAKHAYAWSEVRRDELGKVLGAWGGVVDVTAFEHDAAALRSGLAGLRAAQELTGLATWEWRADARQLIWSDEMYRLAGVPAETFEPTPERWHAFVHPDDLERAQRLDLGADLDAGFGPDSERVETFRLIGPGGEIRHVQSWSATSGERVVYGATIDVTRQVQDRVTLERLSATDPVTGLGNRLAFDRRMQELLTGPGGSPAGRPVAAVPAVTLILLDLDRFKVVNDSLGHQVGDRLLIEVARRLVAVVPNGSVTARMGGDEFVVVPPLGIDELEVRRLASSIVEAMRAPYVLPETGELLICPASLGVAMSERRRVTGHDLLREADIALYRAKDSGRDRYVIFDEALKARTLTRQRAERRLRAALEEDRLVMQYQPVVDFSNGRVIGAEGLVRLHDSEDSDRLIAPDLFLEIAEQTGLVVEIDCWVIETAIEQLARWAGPGEPGPWLAINLSARSMEHPRVIRRLIEAVKRGEVDRDRIKIELTEQSFIGSLPGVDAGVRQLIANGVGVGIDDFGTGYSALAYLQHFELDFMKIDRSFVASVGESPRSDAVVTAIVDLAHAHGMRVIAEGVESGRQARRLREIGCDFAQGFHFGRPGEAGRIVRG